MSDVNGGCIGVKCACGQCVGFYRLPYCLTNKICEFVKGQQKETIEEPDTNNWKTKRQKKINWWKK